MYSTFFCLLLVMPPCESFEWERTGWLTREVFEAKWSAFRGEGEEIGIGDICSLKSSGSYWGEVYPSAAFDSSAAFAAAAAAASAASFSSSSIMICCFSSAYLLSSAIYLNFNSSSIALSIFLNDFSWSTCPSILTSTQVLKPFLDGASNFPKILTNYLSDDSASESRMWFESNFWIMSSSEVKNP